MKYTVFYPTKISELHDVYNDNIDVCITLENGSMFTLVFITPENLKAIMQKSNTMYVDFRFKFIVIEYISEGIIQSVIEEIISDEYFRNYYGL